MRRPKSPILGGGPRGLAAAAALALPTGALAWFEAVYLYFGITGNDAPAWVSALLAVVAFGAAIAWPLWRAERPAQVVRRACNLGLLFALLLPAVTIAVLLLWQHASGRPDLGMGGLMLYSLPFVAFGVTLVLALVYGLAKRSAERRLQDPVSARAEARRQP